MNIIKRAAVAIAGAAALVATSAGAANALSVDYYDDIKYVWCSDSGATVEIDNTNATGGEDSNYFKLSGRIGDGTRSCGWQTLNTGDDVSYVSTWVTNSDGGYVYCAIYVNGVLVKHSEDNSDYYSFVGCY